MGAVNIDNTGSGASVTLSSDGTDLLLNGSPIGGSGDVVGPASSTDNAVVRFDSTTGKLLQNSAVTIGDDGARQKMTELSYPLRRFILERVMAN